MLWIITGVIISYFIGSIPTAYILGRLVKGIDIRQFGSGNVGATNVFRVLGKGWGLVAFIIDVLKGMLPLIILGDFLVAKDLAVSASLLRIILGISSVCGHNWTIFLNFKGGKGIATSLGVLLGLASRISGLYKVVVLLIILWLAVFLVFRIVSLASIIVAAAFPILIVIFRQPLELKIASLLFAIFAIVRHKSNIARIIKGKENKLKF